MSWNDGISKEMDKYCNDILMKIPEVSLESVKEAVDIASNTFYNDIEKSTPVGLSGGLKGSFKQEKINNTDYYGYRNIFEGEDPNGVPYEKIANVLNYGTHDGRIEPNYFVTKAIRKLKSIDKNTVKIYEQKMKSLNERS